MDHPDVYTRYDAAYAAVRSRAVPGRTFGMFPVTTFPLRQGEIERVPTFNTYETLFPIRTFRLRRAMERALSLPAERTQTLLGLRAVGVRYVFTPHDGEAWLESHGLERVFRSPAADVWEDRRALPRIYVAQQARVVPASDALTGVLDDDLSATSAVLLEAEEGPASTTSVSGTAVVLQDDPAHVRVTVEAPAGAMLVVLDAWSPDWRATIDGRPATIRHANYVARAVEIPAGRHEVELRFVPRTFQVGAAITCLALPVCLLLLWPGRRRDRAG